MKSKVKVIFFILFMLSMASCIETHLINTIHRDGSITRKLIIKNTEENEFPPEMIPVPFDSTWAMDTTQEYRRGDENVDSVPWILTATKDFTDVEEINEAYRNDQGSNKELQRSAALSKKFMWFITGYRFSERIENMFDIDCPITDFLSPEELDFYYLPKEVQNEQKKGSDSLRIRKLADSVDTKSEQWMWAVMFRMWTDTFYDLFGDNPNLTITKEEMQSKEKEAIKLLVADDSEGNNNDTSDDMIQLFGKEQYDLLETEIDSSINVLERKTNTFWDVDDYGMEIRMPGRIIASNGYVDTRSDSINGGGILWTVNSDYYLNQPFEMWVESRVNNYWAWVVTLAFVIFVITGFVVRYRNAGRD